MGEEINTVNLRELAYEVRRLARDLAALNYQIKNELFETPNVCEAEEKCEKASYESILTVLRETRSAIIAAGEDAYWIKGNLTM